MKLTLSHQKLIETNGSEDENRHGTLHNGLLFMTTRPLIDRRGQPITSDYEDDFLIVGSRTLRLASGKTQVFSIEIVNKAIHKLVEHSHWIRHDTCEHNGYCATFKNVGLIESGAKSRIVRRTQKPSTAWLGFNRARGHYLAGLEHTNDLYLRKQLPEDKPS